MAHSMRVMLGVFAALGAAFGWVAVVGGGFQFVSLAFDLSGMAPGTRTAVTIGILATTLAGAVAAAGVAYFLVVGDTDAETPSEVDR